MSIQHKILLVDHDPKVVVMLGVSLRLAGYQVIKAEDAKSALEQAQAELPSLIVLEVGSPQFNGFDVCRQLKSTSVAQQIPIIMLSATATEDDRILGFQLGADDFISKPFSPTEMILRINLSLQRLHQDQPIDETINLGGLVLNRSAHQVSIENKSVYLSVIEFKLLELFMEHAGCALDRETLSEKIWGEASNQIPGTINTQVNRLRRKLRSWSRQLETVRGVGYRLNRYQPSFGRRTNRQRPYLDKLEAPLEILRTGKTIVNDNSRIKIGGRVQSLSPIRRAA